MLTIDIVNPMIEPLFFHFKMVQIPLQILLIPFFSISDLKKNPFITISDFENSV